jgi:hypothetical protein
MGRNPITTKTGRAGYGSPARFSVGEPMNVKPADDDAADALVTALCRLISGDFDDLWRPWLTE